MWKFLILYLLLNSLFFLPRYILERKNSSFFPWKGLVEGALPQRIQYLINRFNYDIFRVSSDLFWIVGLVLVFHLKVPTIYVFIPLFLLWAYHLYYHIFENIYKVEPLFYRDFLLLKTGAQLFFRELTLTNVAIFFGVIVVGMGFYYLLDAILELGRNIDFPLWLKTGFGGITLMTIYSLFIYNYKAYGKIVFPWSIQSLWRNIRQSISTKKYMEQFDFKKLSAHRPYQNIRLRRRPNIYFIPIESYGKILLTHPGLKDDYRRFIPRVQQSMEEGGWSVASHLSTAPITGGASWVSYTTALFGFDIKDQGTYLTLLNKEEIREYQHLMRWFQQQGYRNFRLAPIAGFKDMKIPWDTYRDFYAIDEWIKYEQMNYGGALYGFGPCPPDQFSLYFAKNHIKGQGAAPFFLFFITQNSHSPFTPPYQVAQDWRQLAKGTQYTNATSSSIFVQPKLPDYAKAIQYQLSFLGDFIVKEGTANDIFVLIGDHQPPTFPTEKDGMETPIHIISKDRDFVRNFGEYGFTQGLLADIATPPMKHQGFFSMFVRELARSYGVKGSEIPPYRREGEGFFE